MVFRLQPLQIHKVPVSSLLMPQWRPMLLLQLHVQLAEVINPNRDKQVIVGLKDVVKEFLDWVVRGEG